jgi:hypothetical protein
MLVDLGPTLSPVCVQILSSLGYRVVSVAHAPAACERMPVVMPIILVGPSDAVERDRNELRDCAVAVGAHVLWFPRDADAAFVTSALKHAAITALERYAP